MGQKILLRLRPAWASDTFSPEEDIIQTMLHEVRYSLTTQSLTLNDACSYSSHMLYMGQTFYDFLSRLQEGHYELKRTGYAGEAFSNGRRLGAGIPQTVPALIAQQRSIELEIAERRRTNTV